MKRTLKQNNSLHKWCEEVAEELNNRGVTMRALIERLEIDHSKESVKMFWRAIAKAKFGKKSTTELETNEVDKVYEEMNRLLAEFEIHIPFPSEENRSEALESFNQII